MNKASETLTTLVGSVIGWINKLFGFATVLFTAYPKWIMLALVLIAGSKLGKVKLNANLGKK